MIGKYPDNDKCEHTAARKYISMIPPGDLYSMFGNLVRLAAFRLVEAGMETKPGIESRFHMHCKSSWKLFTDYEPHRSYTRATVSK